MYTMHEIGQNQCEKTLITSDCIREHTYVRVLPSLIRPSPALSCVQKRVILRTVAYGTEQHFSR